MAFPLCNLWRVLFGWRGGGLWVQVHVMLHDPLPRPFSLVCPHPRLPLDRASVPRGMLMARRHASSGLGVDLPSKEITDGREMVPVGAPHYLWGHSLPTCIVHATENGANTDGAAT